MKRIKVSVLALTAIFTSWSHAATEQPKFFASNSSISTKLCIAIASNKPLQLHQALKEYRVSRSLIKNKLKCNQMPSSEFVHTYGLYQSGRVFGVKEKDTVIAKNSSKTVTIKQSSITK